MSIKPAPKKAKCLKPFSHIFKNDVKQKYEFIYHYKEPLKITNTDENIYLCTEFPMYCNKPLYKFF